MMGLYVSFIGNPITYTASVTKIIHHCVQRHPIYCAANPPTTGLHIVSKHPPTILRRYNKTHPNDGPANGAIRNSAVTFAL